MNLPVPLLGGLSIWAEHTSASSYTAVPRCAGAPTSCPHTVRNGGGEAWEFHSTGVRRRPQGLRRVRNFLPDSLSGKVFLAESAARRHAWALGLHSNRSAKLLSPTPKLCALGKLPPYSVPQFAPQQNGGVGKDLSELLGRNPGIPFESVRTHSRC